MKTTYTFRAATHDEYGDVSTDIEHTFTTEDYLPDVLYHFKSFLQGVGYNYITDVHAVKNDGEEVGEE